MPVGGCKESTNCKAGQTGQISWKAVKGVKPRQSFYMQETVHWSSEFTLQRKVVMSDEYSIARSGQADFGFGGDAQTEGPSRPDSPCPSGLSA